MSATMRHMLLKPTCIFCQKRQIAITFIAMRAKHSPVVRDIAMDPSAVEQISPRRHPGIMQMRRAVIPERLENAINLLTDKYPTKDLVENSESFSRYLWGRHPPMPDDVFKAKAAEAMQKVKDKDGHINLEELTPERLITLESKWKGHALQILRQQTYHWKPVTYDPYRGFLYMVTKVPQDYGVLLRCFSEILKRAPSFRPRAIFDLGSGCGTTIWAANKIWGTKVFQYYCVDHSASMNTLARLLLQDGEQQKDMSIPGVTFRQFMPSSQQNSFNMVVCAYTLFEFPNTEARLANIAALWEMTEEFLVLVDNGTYAGYTLLLEARDYILNISESSESPSQKGHVFAPCTHEFSCPKLSQKEKKIPCNFEVMYRPLKIVSFEEVKKSLQFCYIILRKGPRQPEDVNWPRIVDDVLKRTKHVHTHLCCPNGNIEHKVMTLKKTDKVLYKCTRYSARGDLIPVVWNSEKDTSSRDDLDESSHEDHVKSSHEDLVETSHIKSSHEDHRDVPRDNRSDATHDDRIGTSLDECIQSWHEDHEFSHDDHDELSQDDYSEVSHDDYSESLNDDRSEMSLDDHSQRQNGDTIDDDAAVTDSEVYHDQTDFNVKEVDPNDNILQSEDCSESLPELKSQSISAETDNEQCVIKDEPLPT